MKFDDVKILLKALGLFAGDSQIQREAGKKSIWWEVALTGFAAAMKKL